MGPGALAEIMMNLPKINDANLLVGTETNDDACVYRLRDDLAIVQTVDFFPPMVDDPFLFGQIAAANALSDVYAMGARPIAAMNLLCFPSCLDLSVAGEILRGGADKADEAGCVIAGGHSVTDEEPKYGLCVTGVIHPVRILRNGGVRPGDSLILTKRIGTGLITTACKNGIITAEQAAAAFDSMRALNRRAAEIASGFTVHACTDITGFGLAGHICEMAEASRVTVALQTSSLPLLPHAYDLAKDDAFPGGMYRNRDHFAEQVDVEAGVPEAMANLYFDPQTSGGLLFAVPSSEAGWLLEALRKEIPAAAVIGQAGEKADWLIHIGT
jgi:selenide,water dikinase